MPALRIPGLVRAMNDVRAQLAAGIPRGEVEAFRAHVTQVVRDVEQIAAVRRARPTDLPAPSYRAFQFLKTLDLRRLPLRPDGAPPPPPFDFRVTNLVAICDGLHAVILELLESRAGSTADRHTPARRPAAGDPQIAELRARIARDVAATEEICRDAGTSPLDLPIRTRRAWQWARFLARPGNLEAHVATVAAVLAVGRPMLAADRRLRERGIRTLTVRLYHSNTLVGGRVEADTYGLRLSQGLMGAPDAVIDAAVRSAFGESWRLPMVRDYGHSAAFREVMAQLEGVGEGARWSSPESGGTAEGRAGLGTPETSRLGGPDDASPGATGNTAADPPGDSLIRDIDDDAAGAVPPSPADLRATGRHHNLAAAFDRVNRTYFNGRMPRPKLTWNATYTRRKLGHYDFHTDTVMLSITLDDPKVPGYVVDFVMYHELLHKQLGVRAVNGRRRVHTPEFRKAERRFREWRRVERWMRGVG